MQINVHGNKYQKNCMNAEIHDFAEIAFLNRLVLKTQRIFDNERFTKLFGQTNFRESEIWKNTKDF